jgi:hypothetical protein
MIPLSRDSYIDDVENNTILNYLRSKLSITNLTVHINIILKLLQIISVSATQFGSDDPDLLQRPAVTAENLDLTRDYI